MSLLSRSRAEPVDLDAVRAASGQVRDPELYLTLSEAGMLEDVELAKPGVVRVTVRLTTATCPLKEQLTAAVTDAVGGLVGVAQVEIRFTTMSDSERLVLAGRLRGARPEGTHQFGDGSATKIYAVASGKGGVGKSSVTANLAVALAQQGQRVGVLDADVWGYSIPQLFGVRRAPVALKGLMLPVSAHGVSLMSVGFFVDDEEPVVWRGPMLHKAIEQFLSDVHWGELDTLLLDLPPGTGDVTMSLLELLPDAQLLAVTTPQLAAQTVAARVGKMARDVRMPIAGVVENMTSMVCPRCDAHTPIFGEGGGLRLAQSIDAPLLGQIPLDLELRTAGDAGVPAVVSHPTAESSMELRRIASGLPVVRRSLVGRSLPLSVL